MIMEARQAIKACGISSREYRDMLLNYNVYRRYVEAEYGTVDSFMRRGRIYRFLFMLLSFLCIIGNV